MIEYEYSYKVKEIKPFIDYCEKNNYKKIKESFQTRILYNNGNGMLARITKTLVNGKEIVEFNFKDEANLEEKLNVSRESPMLIVNESNEKFIDSMLEMLDFKKFKELKRKRYVYEKEKVKFEIDDYIEPEMKVLAVEGDKSKVDKVVTEIKESIDELKI